MNRWTDIILKATAKGKNFFLLAIVSLLCGCGDCDTLQTYLGDGVGSFCMICTIFNMVADAAVTSANKSWDALSEPLGTIVILVTAVYIAIFTLKLVSSFGKQNAADYMTGDKKGILVLIFKMAVIFGVLDGFDRLSGHANSQWFINAIVTPILNSAVEIGNEVSALQIPSGILSSSSTGWEGTFEMLKIEVQAFNDNIYLMIALGKAMICNATPSGFLGILGWYHLMLFYGFIYFIFGWMLLAAAGLFMIDAGLTLAIVAILLPFGIACAISEWSVSYAKNIWNMFLTVFFSFIILGIIVGLSLSLVFHCVGSMDAGDIAGAAFAAEEIAEISDAPDAETESFDLIAAIDSNNVKAISEYLWSSGSLLLTILCFLLVIQLLEQMKELAQKLSDGTGFSSASQVGGDLAKPIAHGGQKLATWTKDAAVSRITKSLGKTKAAKWIQKKYTTFRGKVFGVGAEGYKAWWR